MPACVLLVVRIQMVEGHLIMGVTSGGRVTGKETMHVA